MQYFNKISLYEALRLVQCLNRPHKSLRLVMDSHLKNKIKPVWDWINLIDALANVGNKEFDRENWKKVIEEHRFIITPDDHIFIIN